MAEQMNGTTPEIQRYSEYCAYTNSGSMAMRADGRWVSYADHRRIVAEKDARIAYLEALRQTARIDHGEC